MALHNVVNDNHCPHCHNKTEQMLLEILVLHGINIQKHAAFDWCKNPETGYYLPFDFVINDMMIIIELDGGQHFRQVKHWAPLKENRRRDWFKMRAALTNGYSVIRVLQDDVWYNRNDWLGILLSEIEKYAIPELIFISATGAYDDFENMYDELSEDTYDTVDVIDPEIIANC